MRVDCLKPSRNYSISQSNYNNYRNNRALNSNYGRFNNTQSINFGIDPISIALIVRNIVLVAGSIATITVPVAIVDKVDREKVAREDEQRAYEEKQKEELREKTIQEIQKAIHASYDDAEDYLNMYMKISYIPPSEGAGQKGLNAVQGYGAEKYKLMMDFLTPIIAAQKDPRPKLKALVPNGLLLYGPTGSGKTHIAKKLCEHLNEFGVNTVAVELDNVKSGKSPAHIITEAFYDAEEHYKRTGQYTVLNFKDDMDRFLYDTELSPDCRAEVAAILRHGDKCASRGVIMLMTANHPKTMDKAVFRAGRVDLKMAIGNMKDFEIAEYIKYILAELGEEKSTHTFDYQKVIDYVSDNHLTISPAEYENAIKYAISHKSDRDYVNADTVIEQLASIASGDELGYSLDEETLRRFELNQEYMKDFIIPKKPYKIERVPGVYYPPKKRKNLEK